jgi:hypothetical protein
MKRKLRGSSENKKEMLLLTGNNGTCKWTVSICRTCDKKAMK